MLGALSYFNLLLSVIYFLTYLQNGSRWAIAGLLVVVIFNWATLRNIEKQQFKWSVPQFIIAIPTALFALYTGYGAILLLSDAAEYQYYPWNTVLLVTSGLIFALALLFQLILAYLKNSGKKM